MTGTSVTPPQGWAEDELSNVIDTANGNGWATFANKSVEYKLLSSVDQQFHTIATHLHHNKAGLPALLFLRCHSAYRAACRLVIGGQIAEGYVVLRSVIEYALYSVHIYANDGDGLDEVWMKRSDSDDTRKACRKAFQTTVVMQSLKKVAEPKLADAVASLYERTIDFGAHPNELALTTALHINDKEDGAVELQQQYIVHDGDALALGLKTTAQIGVGALLLFRYILKERFDILGVTQKVDELKANL